jgi:hypothetical protein
MAGMSQWVVRGGTLNASRNFLLDSLTAGEIFRRDNVFFNLSRSLKHESWTNFFTQNTTRLAMGMGAPALSHFFIGQQINTSIRLQSDHNEGFIHLHDSWYKNPHFIQTGISLVAWGALAGFSLYRNRRDRSESFALFKQKATNHIVVMKQSIMEKHKIINVLMLDNSQVIPSELRYEYNRVLLHLEYLNKKLSELCIEVGICHHDQVLNADFERYWLELEDSIRTLWFPVLERG